MCLISHRISITSNQRFQKLHSTADPRLLLHSYSVLQTGESQGHTWGPRALTPWYFMLGAASEPQIIQPEHPSSMFQHTKHTRTKNARLK